MLVNGARPVSKRLQILWWKIEWNKFIMQLSNYPPKHNKLPIIITQPKDDYLNRKAIFGPRRGQFLRFNRVDDDPYEVTLFYEHRFHLIKVSLQIGHESLLLTKTPTTFSMSQELFLQLINKCFTPNILVFGLSIILLFIKKNSESH